MGRIRRIGIREYRKNDRLRLQDTVEQCTVKQDKVAWKHPAYTIVTSGDERPIACGGIIIDGQTGECWVNISTEALKYKKSLCKYLAGYGSYIVNKYNLRSVFAYVNEDFELGKQLVERFGLTCRAYSDGNFIYVKEFD